MINKNQSGRVTLIVCCSVVILLIVSVVLFNNRHLILGAPFKLHTKKVHSEKTEDHTHAAQEHNHHDKHVASVTSQEHKTDEAHGHGQHETPVTDHSGAESEIVEKYKTDDNGQLESIDIGNIQCQTRDRKDVLLLLSLRLVFPLQANKDEILFKRDEFKVLTKKTIYKMELHSIDKKRICKELQDMFNSILSEKWIQSVEFIAFSLEKV